MRSFALLYKNRQSENPCPCDNYESDLHINYWKLPKTSSDYDRFVDIGIMINNVKNDIESLYVYLPFKVVIDDLEDLGHVLSENDLICNLFGADYESRNGVCTSYCYADCRANKEKSFWIYQLEKPNFKVAEKQGGSIIEISIKSYPDNASVIQRDSYCLYIRFRINNLSLKKAICL